MESSVEKKMFVLVVGCSVVVSQESSLVCGDVSAENFDTLIGRVEGLLKKNVFDVLFIAGEVVSEQCKDVGLEAHLAPFLAGQRHIPIPTYFCHATLDPQLVCRNLVCVGPFGLLDVDGLRVGFLWEESDKDLLLQSGVSSDSKDGIDILFSRRWPKGLLNGLAAAETLPKSTGWIEYAHQAAEVCLDLGPRYVFSPGQAFYERPPYFSSSHPSHVTRFFSVASVGNVEKEKWLYAFRLSHLEKSQAVEGTSSCPFTMTTTVQAVAPKSEPKMVEQSEGGFQRWATTDSIAQGGRDNSRKRKQQPGQAHQLYNRGQDCWFCLESANAEQHLVVSVGEHCYLALAKGGFTNDHVLILPLTHSEAVLELAPNQLDEVERYKSSLKAFAAEKGDRQVMFYERNIPTKYNRPHCHVQAMPLSRSAAEKLDSLLRDWKRLELVGGEFPYEKLAKACEGANYFWIEIGKFVYFSTTPEGLSFNYGREIYGQAVGDMKRVDWKRCVVSLEEEKKLAEQFTAKFKQYDKVLFK